MLEKLEIQAVDLKCEFDITMSKHKSLFSTSSELINQNVNKPKFKPRDLGAPKWSGNLVTHNAWKQQIRDYFRITDLTTDPEQLIVLLYRDVLPNPTQFSIRDCTNVNEKTEFGND